MDKVEDRARKGRGAVSNRVGRFEPAERVAVDDGWGGADEELPPLRTSVGVDATRRIITTNESPDIPFDQSINPYKGCEHGCVYCFARPTHAYLGLSPGLDFETRLFAKPDAAKLLERELRHPRYRCKVIAMGTNTDPYQPVEKTMGITRAILEVLAAHDHPVTIVTKSALILRDLDILAPMAAKGLAAAAISVTTLDRDLARRMEPRAATPERRLEAIRGLAAAGVPTGVMAAPMIPALNDMELERILERAAAAGATTAGYVVLRLPLEIKELWEEWLATHVPGKAAHVMTLVRDMRGGKEYDSRWGKRMRGTGVYADLIAQRFAAATRKLGLTKRDWKLDTSRFRRPAAAGQQLTLL